MKPALKRVVAGIPQLLPFIGLLFVISGIIGLVFVQQPVNETQEIRSDASIEDGATEITSLTNPSDDLETLGQETTLSLGLNTHNTPVSSVTVVFNIITEITDELEIVFPAFTGATTTSELETTEDGFLALVTLEPTGSFIATNHEQKFLELHFTPRKVGEFELNFDREESTAPHKDTQEDTLNHISTLSYTIVEQPEDDTISSCNETCSVNDECASGYRCYDLGSESRCRLAVNPTSSSCDSEDDSEKRECNEGCEANRDCQSGLSCYENRCRNPRNLISTSCAAPAENNSNSSTNDTSQSNQTTEIKSCNESCSFNSDCAVNYRCYEGACRLVTNPSSSSCSAITEKTVSERYTKGGVAPSSEEEATESAQTATESAQATPTPVPSASPTASPEPTAEEETAWDTLVNLLNKPESRLPLMVVGAGLALLILGGISYAMIKHRTSKQVPPPTNSSKPPSQPPTPTIPPAATTNSQQNQENTMVDRLKNKGVTPPTLDTKNQQINMDNNN